LSESVAPAPALAFACEFFHAPLFSFHLELAECLEKSDRIRQIELYKVNCQTLGYTRDVPKASARGKSMFHLIWYILIGLISGVIAKSVMHVHLAIFWTIVLGIIGSIIGGGVSHMFSRPTNERYHPAGLILSTLGAILVLFICYKLKIHFPQV
jgi:uncharacterized membrane protein YeaQ/YmgE (transglycosylase-associated protein family)